ncbi:MAG: type I-C CRISPR-associated protein Cas5 [Thermaceae bacterium]|nr:type I-C CRISPR-associated protein Cas5 [Thermaceae bacterium]
MKTFVLEVWGDFACFTRPEFKVERFSYPVMTPSAARAIFDAIYLEFNKGTPKQPAMYWQVEHIEIVQPVRYIALMRNEVKEKISESSVKKWMKDPSKLEPIFADATREETGQDTKGRTQRQTMALKGVRYRIHAHAVLYSEDQQLRQKVEHSFERRAGNGQCFYQPYLGCREFSAFFRLVEPGERAPTLAPHDEHIGWMLYDVFDLSRPGSSTDKPSISLFEAEISDGILHVPPYSSSQVRKPRGGA